MRTHLATLVADFRRHGAQTAIVCYRGNRRHETTYLQLAELTGRFASELMRRGIQPGERVLLWGENRSEWVAAFFGCVLRGVLVVPLDSAGSRDFAHRVIAETSPRLVVGNESLLAQLPQEPPQIPFEQFAAALPQESQEPPLPTLNPDTPLQILFTSGTTGTPKGIVHTHRNILASLTPIEREVQRYLRYERWVHPLRFLHTLPLSHVFGQFVGLWTPALLGAEVHFEPRLLASQLVERIIHRERISLIAAVPRVLDLLRSHLLALQPDLQQQMDAAQAERVWRRWWRFRRQHNLLGWKCWAFVCGGATLPAELERFWTTLGFVLLQGYGMTETAALVTLSHPLRPVLGTIGKPLPGRDVKIGDDGEMLVRGEMVYNALWQQGRMVPRESEWLATGDLAARDAEGNLRFLGRKGDLIVTAAGMNIHPQDLEQALEKQPGVRECTVVGISTNPDDPTAQEPVAVLLAANETDARDAVEAANRELAEFQQMRRWLLWPGMDLPRTSTGKVVKRTVAAWAQQASSATSSAAPTSYDPLLQLLAHITHAPLATTEGTARLSEDLHLDSLGRVELQAALEEKFGIELSEEIYQQTLTLGQLRVLVQPATGTTATAIPASSKPIPQPVETRYVYPYWIWAWPVRIVRAAFQNCIAKPILGLLAAPRVHLLAPLPQQPALFIANHITMFDVPMVLYALPRRVRQRITVAMAGEMLMDWRYRRNQGNCFLNLVAPLEYWALSALYSIFPLPQFSNFRRSFAHAGEALDRGLHVLVFPEGSRSADGTLHPFQSGIGLLTQEAQTSVVPVVMRGLGEIKTRRQRWFRPGTLDIYIGAPMNFAASATAEEITAALQKEMERLLAFGAAD